MKITDLKKELKSHGLSTIGNKSELMARLGSVVTETDDSLTINNNNDTDIVVDEEEDELLATDLLNSSQDKEDDSLVEDLLNSNQNNKIAINKPKTSSTTIKRSTLAVVMKAINDNNGSQLNSSKNDSNIEINEELSKEKSPTSHLLKTSNAIKLSNVEIKDLRSKKFSDNKLVERALRFGIKSDDGSHESKDVLNIDSNNANEKLKIRAQRFGAIVSDKMKTIEDKEKLVKRMARFGAITVANTDVSKDANTKRAITFSAQSDDRKKQRLQRFSIKS